jgi:hypothetical protein
MNYNNSKIYKICSLNTDKIYIGSTIRKYLSDRMGEHRYQYRQWKINNNNNRYITSFELLDKYNDCKIILLENYSCNSIDELHARERYYIELYKNICVNKIIPTRTKKEYAQLEKVKEYKKKYYEEHILEKKEYDIEYRNNNKEKHFKKIDCECGGKYLTKHKSTHIKTQIHKEYIMKK